jgi:Lar family restriction alleviation protein
MADELKPCPFCGGEARLTQTGVSPYVVCERCSNSTALHGTQELAIAAWNTRAAPEPSEADVRLEERKWCVDVAREMGSQYGYEIAEEIERRSEPLARAALAALRAAKEKEHG